MRKGTKIKKIDTGEIDSTPLYSEHGKHFEGLSEDQIKLIKLMVNIFIKSIGTKPENP